MTEPLLSICIPTYNRGKFLDKSLEELTAQNLFKNTDEIQIVISDNCSTDETEIVCQKYVEKFPDKIKYIRQEETIFAPYNIMGVLDCADGKFIKLQNDNIYFTHDGLERLVNIIKQDNSDIIFCINQKNGKEACLKSFDTLDDIVSSVSYMTNWMCAHCYRTSVYRKLESIQKYMLEWVSSVDVLFRMADNGARFVCLYDIVFDYQMLEKKGGRYNVAEVYGKGYLGLLKEYVANGKLSKSVYNREKKKILLKHINYFYFDLNHLYNFEKTGYFKYVIADYWYEPYFYFAYIMILIKMFLSLFVSVDKDSTYSYVKILGLVKLKFMRKSAKNRNLKNNK